MKAPTLISSVLFAASLACFLGTAGAARQDAATNAIATQSQALMAAIEKGDATAVADLFTADAKLSVPQSRGAISGRADILKFWQAALGGGLKGLRLKTEDILGDGNLRVVTGSYVALGADSRALGNGQYLLAWTRSGGQWKISRDFAHGDIAPTTARVPDRVGLPREYATGFQQMGDTVNDDSHGLTTVYANDLAATAASSERAHYPDGSVILMEFAEPQRDGEDQLLRDAHGQPLKGSIAHIDVMRRGGGFGEIYGTSRAGEWEFASYRADGSALIEPANATLCAACHLKAGEEKDFVYRLRSWAPVRETMPDPPSHR